MLFILIDYVCSLEYRYEKQHFLFTLGFTYFACVFLSLCTVYRNVLNLFSKAHYIGSLGMWVVKSLEPFSESTKRIKCNQISFFGINLN